MKKTISLFLSLVMLLSVTAGLNLAARAGTSGDYEYEVRDDSDSAQISEYEEWNAISNEIVSVTPEPLVLEENQFGWYFDSVIYDEDGKEQTVQYFHYMAIPDVLNVMYKDGSSDIFYIYAYGDDEHEAVWKNADKTNSISAHIGRNDSGQSYENQWKAGNTYEVKSHYLDLEVNYTVTIIPNNECTHDTTKIEGFVPATNTEDGYTGNVVCAGCGKLISEGKIIPMTGEIKLSRTEINYTATVQRPLITIADSTGNNLVYKTDFTVDYSDWNSTDVGEYTVTVNFLGNYEGSQTFTYKINAQSNVVPILNRSEIKMTGTVQRPTVTVSDVYGNNLTYKKDFTVDYSDWNSTDVGRYTVTINMIGNYSGSFTYPYYINPRPVSFLTSAQGGFKAIKNGFTLTWNKQANQTTGYQLQFATKRDFSNAATVWIENPETTSCTIPGRAGNTRYYVRIRPYTQIDNGTFFGNWDYEDNYIKSVVTL